MNNHPNPPLVIYHADCNDGLTAAWAIQKFYREGGNVQVDLYAAKYQQPPPDVTGRHVIMVDFSYKRPVLLEMAEKAQFILILDHHKSAQEDLAGLEDPKGPNGHRRIKAVFDMDRSGAGIAWDWHFAEKDEDGYHPSPRPWFVNYIEDNDLWRHKMDHCKAVLEFIRSYPAAQHMELFDQWTGMNTPNASMIDEGYAILRAKEILVQQAMTFAQEVNYPGIGLLKVCNVPFFLSSDVGHALSEYNKKTYGTAAGVTYYHTKDGKISLSFRSVGEYDVSALAIVHGGGGHRNASGAAVDRLPWEPVPNGLAHIPLL